MIPLCHLFPPGHVDDAEPAMYMPIVSFSVGQTGIYLLGGKTKDVPPIAMFMRSGDCMVMGGEARRAYHGKYLVKKQTCVT